MHVFALIAVVKLNASRKSKHKLIVEREQEIAVKVTPWKECFGHSMGKA